jgi:hypothetical protein
MTLRGFISSKQPVIWVNSSVYFTKGLEGFCRLSFKLFDGFIRALKSLAKPF